MSVTQEVVSGISANPEPEISPIRTDAFDAILHQFVDQLFNSEVFKRKMVNAMEGALDGLRIELSGKLAQHIEYNVDIDHVIEHSMIMERIHEKLVEHAVDIATGI